jgi:cyclic beta-1,2-glucan synthetase
VEVRRVTLANLSDRSRRVEVTSYSELALAAHAADRAHPAFSKLFIRTEALRTEAPGTAPALLAWRTPRGANEPAMWATHVLALPSMVGENRNGIGSGNGSGSEAQAPDVQFETSRGRFIGRGRTLQRPAALEGDLSNEAGHVLDPIFSLRGRVTLSPGERLQLAFVTGAAADRAGAVSLAEKYRDMRAVERVVALSRSQAQLVPRQMRVSVEDLGRFRRLASHVLFPSATLRASEQALRRNRLGQSRLWSHGISGDLPIVLVQIGDTLDLDLAREALTAHAYWRMQGLKVDLVILDQETAGYEQPLREELTRLVQVHGQATGLDQPGGVFLRRAAHLPAEDEALLLAVARVVLVAAQRLLGRPQRRAREQDVARQPPEPSQVFHRHSHLARHELRLRA